MWLFYTDYLFIELPESMVIVLYRKLHIRAMHSPIPLSCHVYLFIYDRRVEEVCIYVYSEFRRIINASSRSIIDP